MENEVIFMISFSFFTINVLLFFIAYSKIIKLEKEINRLQR